MCRRERCEYQDPHNVADSTNAQEEFHALWQRRAQRRVPPAPLLQAREKTSHHQAGERRPVLGGDARVRAAARGARSFVRLVRQTQVDQLQLHGLLVRDAR